MTDEAIDDVYAFQKYIFFTLCNPSAADNFGNSLRREIDTLGIFPLKFSPTEIYYQGYVIHKKVYKSYLLFYIINHDKKEIYVLRILKDIMDWEQHLKTISTYHMER